MEKLSRQHSDTFVTPSDLCAIVPLKRSLVIGDSAIFEFKTMDFAPTIRVEWPKDSPYALVDNDVAVVMVKRGWARHLTDEEANAYNEAVDLHLASLSGAPPPVVTEPPTPVVTEPPPPVVTDPAAPPVVGAFQAFGVASPKAPDVVSSTGKSAESSKTKR